MLDIVETQGILRDHGADAFSAARIRRAAGTARAAACGALPGCFDFVKQ